MDEKIFRQLQRGEWVATTSGNGIIVHFGRFNGKRWVRSARKRANGIWVWFAENDEGYIHRHHIIKYLPAPPFGYVYRRAK